MTTAEAFAQLDQWAAQIVHGKNLFREVADTLRRELELSRDAYQNMKAFAEANGLDTTTTSP
jgi:hypothetical protein